MTTPRSSARTACVAVAGLLALLVAGCGGGDDRTSPVAAPAASPATASSAAAPTASSGPATASSAPAEAGAGRCATGQLRLGLGSEEGAAGSTYRPLTFVNTGTAACTVDGHPGVSYVAGDDGHQVGAAAGRTGTPAPVTLAPGATASATLRIVNPRAYDAATCLPTPVTGLRVYPPDQTAAAFLPGPATACAATGVVLLTTGPVRAGATG